MQILRLSEVSGQHSRYQSKAQTVCGKNKAKMQHISALNRSLPAIERHQVANFTLMSLLFEVDFKKRTDLFWQNSHITAIHLKEKPYE